MEGFNFFIPCTVRAADINYGGHVSNAVVLNYFQDARISYLQQVGGFSELDIGGRGIILSEAHLYFRAEMFLGDRLVIRAKVSELRHSVFVLDYRIERDGETTAEGTTNLVTYDYQKRKPVRLPDEFRQAVAIFERSET